MKLKLKRRIHKKQVRIRFNIDKLKDPNVEAIFQAQLGGRFAALRVLENDIDNFTNDFNEAISTTANEVLGKQQVKKQPWISDEALSLCDKRRELRKTKRLNLDDNIKYQEINKNIRTKMTTAKNNWFEQKCVNIEKGLNKGRNTKEAYKLIKEVTQSHKSGIMIIEDRNGDLVTEKNQILKRFTEYTRELYNYNLNPDKQILADLQTDERPIESLPILREEVEEAIRSLPNEKSPGIDGIPGELIKHGGESMISTLTEICQKCWEQKKWPTEWTKSIIIPLPKKGNTKQCQNYRTISLICHASKVLLRIILNRLKSQAESLLAEEQAGFRPGRSSMEQICNCRLLIEKHLQHQKDLFHNFIDFKKAFDRVWHEGLWGVLRSFNIEEGLVEIIQALYGTSRSAVLLSGQLGEFFETTVGVRQGCLLSPILFNLYLERIMREALATHESSISIGGRELSNLRFADDIDLIAGSNDELQELTDKLADRSNAYGMEMCSEKSNVMVNTHNNGISVNIMMNDQKLEEVHSFKYLGSVITKDGSSDKDVGARIGQATSAFTRLDTIWKSNTLSFKVKVKIFKTLVVSIFLYGCESWTLKANTCRRIQAFEMKAYRKLLRISYTEHKTNEFVRNRVEELSGPQELLLETVKRRKLTWYGHVNRHNSLAKTIMQGSVEGIRRRGKQRKCWMDNILEWTNMDLQVLLRQTEDREQWRKITTAASRILPPTTGEVTG